MLTYLIPKLKNRDLTFIYLFLFCFFLSAIFLPTTMIGALSAPEAISIKYGFEPMVSVGTISLGCARLFCAGMVIYAVFLVQYKWWEVVLSITAVSLGLAVYANSGSEDVLFASVAIVCAKGTSFRQIAWVYLVVSAVLSILAYILAVAGITEMLVYLSVRGGRWSFGSVYPTDFCAHIFFMACAWFYLRYSKLNLFDVVLFGVLAAFCLIMCQARNSTICLAFLAAIALAVITRRLVFANYTFKGPKNIFFGICMVVPIVLAMTMILLSYYYDPSNSMLSQLDKIFSSRLQLANKGFIDYDVQPFGQNVPMIGNGGSVSPVSNYFFLDSSYINILLRLGWITFFSVLIIYELVIGVSWKKGIPAIAICVMLTFLHSFMEHHFIELAYNVFLLTASADWLRGKSEAMHCGRSASGLHAKPRQKPFYELLPSSYRCSTPRHRR